MEKVKYQEEEEHGRLRTQLLDMLTDESNFRRLIVDSLGDVFGFSQTKFSSSNLHLLRSERFENLFAGFVATGQGLNTGYYFPLKIEIEKILTLVRSELSQ